MRRLVILAYTILSASQEIAFALPRPLIPDATRLRVLLATDTEAKGTAESMKQNQRNFLKQFGDIMSFDSGSPYYGRITVDTIPPGTRLTPQMIRDYYGRLQTEPNEVLLFMYSGHGGNDPILGQFLEMSGGQMLISEVVRVMEAKYTRSVLLIIEACSNYSIYQPLSDTMAPADSPRLTDDDLKRRDRLIRDLFFSPVGRLVFHAASPGESSWNIGDSGSIFFNTVLDLLKPTAPDLDADGNGYVSWNEVAQVVTEQTNNSFHEKQKIQPVGHPMRSQVDQRPVVTSYPFHPYSSAVHYRSSMHDFFTEANGDGSLRMHFGIRLDIALLGCGGKSALVWAYPLSPTPDGGAETITSNKPDYFVDHEGRVGIARKVAIPDNKQWFVARDVKLFLPWDALPQGLSTTVSHLRVGVSVMGDDGRYNVVSTFISKRP